MDRFWKVLIGGAGALAASWVYDASGLDPVIAATPLGAVEHGDVGLAEILVAREGPEGAKDYLYGAGATLIVMEFLSSNSWGIGKPTQGLSMALHGVLLSALGVSALKD